MTHKDKEARKQNRLQKLGTNDPICGVCGETDWRCFEQHHIAGRKYHDDMVNICANCHRKLTDDQKDYPTQASNPLLQEEVIGRFLLGVADLLEQLIQRLREFGHALIESVRECKS